MTIPVLNSHDVLLRRLLEKQVDDFNAWVDVIDLIKALPGLDSHLSDADKPLPRSVHKDLRLLERHRLIEFTPENPHVRLTPLGVYTALLFEVQNTA